MNRFRPGPRLLRLLAACAAVAAFAFFWAPLAALSLGAVLAIALLAVAEGAWLNRANFTLTRPAIQVIPLGEAGPLKLSIANDLGSTLALTVRVLLPDSVGGGALTQTARANPGQPLALIFFATGLSRGHSKLGAVYVAMTRFSLLERIVELSAPGEVRVLPNLRAVQRLHQQLNHRFLRGLGIHMAPRLGQGRDFDRMRDYVPGDELRNIAWKASARQRKLIVREFRVDRSQDVILCVDRGHRMAGRVSALTRCDHAVNAGVLAAYLCNRSDDRVGMLSFAAEVETGLAQGRGAGHLAGLTRFATGIEPDYLHTDYLALAAHLRRRLRSRSLVLLFTVLPERGEHHALLSALKTLLPRHLPLVVVLKDAAIDAAAKSLPANRQELSRTLAASELTLSRAQLVREMRSMGALVVEATPEESGLAAINAYLDVKRRQLL